MRCFENGQAETELGSEYEAYLDKYEEDRYESANEDPEDEDEDEDDHQPSEYDEWQDYMGGDDWDHGQYDEYHGQYDEY